MCIDRLLESRILLVVDTSYDWRWRTSETVGSRMRYG